MSKILIVDDEKDMCWTLSKYLEKNGYSAIAVQDGDSALEKVRSENLNLVLLDMQMPDKNGLQVLKEMKATNPRLPVVLITGYGSPEVGLEAIRLGANGYLTKPFDNRSLLSMVMRHEKSSPPVKNPIPSLPKYLEDKIRETEKPSPPENAAAPVTPLIWNITFKHIFLGIPALAAVIWFAYPPLTEYAANKFGPQTRGLSNNHPSAITAKKNSVWVADWYTQKIYEYSDRNSSIKKSFDLKNIVPSGMAWVGNDLYVTDYWQKKIHLLKLSENSRIANPAGSWKSPGSKPVGLCWDGENLWSTDLDNHKIYRHNVRNKLEVEAEFTYAGKNLNALSWDGKNLWSMDVTHDKIYRHRSSNGMTIDLDMPLRSDRSGLKNPVGFSVDSRSIWILYENPSMIVKKIKPTTPIPGMTNIF